MRLFNGSQDVGLGLLAVQRRTRGFSVEMLDEILSVICLVVASGAVVSGCGRVIHRYMIYHDTFK